MRSRAPRWLRLFALILGAALVFWVTIEDRSERVVLFFSILICGLGAVHLMIRIASDEVRGNTDEQSKPITKLWIIYPLIGSAAGLAVTPVALFLMAFKSGVHGHGAPDYNPAQVMTVLSTTPLWILVGCVLGSAWGLVKR